MKIELRKVKHFSPMSRETEAFVADVYVNGEPKGTVENDGGGGTNLIYPQTLARDLEVYAKTLPPHQGKYGPLSMSADFLISLLLEDHLTAQDLKKRLKKKILFLRDGKIYETKGGFINDTPGVKILNDLPFDEALKLFKEFVK